MLIYKGISLIDGVTPVMVTLAESVSNNSKTGPMVQAFILVDNGLHPAENTKQGTDVGICGGCPFRPANGGGCYASIGPTGMGMSSNWRSNKGRERASEAQVDKLLRGRMLRMGAYGDPAAVPASFWQGLLSHGVVGWTGYTHQWRTCDTTFAKLCMASVETQAQAEDARAKGYRTFRVATSTEGVDKANEIVCVNTTHGKTCSECGLCDGSARSAKIKSIVIEAHGSTAKAAKSAVQDALFENVNMSREAREPVRSKLNLFGKSKAFIVRGPAS